MRGSPQLKVSWEREEDREKRRESSANCWMEGTSHPLLPPKHPTYPHPYSHTRSLHPSIQRAGDFVVMLLQTARFLMKCVGLARKGSELPGLTQYLAPFRDPSFSPLDPSSPSPSISSVDDCLSVDTILSLFRRRALVAVYEAEGRVRRGMQEGATHAEAYNKSAISLVTAARAHCMYFLMSRFVETLNGTVSGERTGVGGVVDG